MQGWILLTLVLVSLSSLGTNGQTTDAAGKEVELKTMLRTVLEQNRRLVLQNTRLQQVWYGMQKMCKALTMGSCDCNNGGNITTDNGNGFTNGTTTTSPTNSSGEPNGYGPLRILSIGSSGAVNDSTDVTVKYSGTKEHTTEWIGLRANGGMWRTSGKRSKDPSNGYKYISDVTVEQLSTMRNLFFRLYNDDESVNIRLNLTELLERQNHSLVQPAAGYLKVDRLFAAPDSTDLNITAVVNENARDFKQLAYAEVFFTGLNTTASPPAIFEIMNFNSDGLGLSMTRRNETTSNMTITLRYPYVQYGGILTVRMPYKESMSGLVEEFYYGPFIKIVAPGTKDVVPPNTIGIFPVARQMVVFPPTQSMICAAMGNPRPEVQILKNKRGNLKEMPAETVILDSSMNMKVFTFTSDKNNKNEGRYLCRATNGNQTIDAPTEVIVLDAVKFDDTKTGIMKNLTDTILISCKATGNPRPELQLKLYDEYGPDLLKSGMYKVWTTEPNRMTSRVTLTLSTADDRSIHTVYCVSNQRGPNGGYEVSRKIDVYPGMEKNHDWALYQRMLDTQSTS